MSRIVALSIAALVPDMPDRRAPGTWLALALAITGSALTWKLLAFVYADFVRPRLDRFVRDSRLRSGTDDDAITLGILARNGGAFDDHIIGALDREAERFATAVGDALTARAEAHGAFLRERVFAREILETAQFRARIDQSQTTLDAVAAGLEGVSAAQLAQGRALAEMPRISATLDTLTRAIEQFTASTEAVSTRLEALAVGQGEMRGALEVVRSIVLGRPPEGLDERRHGPVRRAEDAAAAALIHELRAPASERAPEPDPDE